MKKSRIIVGVAAAAAGAATAYALTKQGKEQQEKFTGMMIDRTKVVKHDMARFLMSLSNEDYQFVSSIYKRLSRSRLFQNEVSESLDAVHAAGNKTSNEIVSIVMKLLTRKEKQKMVQFIDTYKDDLRELLHVDEMDRKDFSDWLDSYYAAGSVIDKDSIRRLAKLADIDVDEDELARLESSYV